MENKTVLNGGILVMKTRPTIIVDVILLLPALGMWYLIYEMDKYFDNEIARIGAIVFALAILGMTLRNISTIIVTLFTRYYLTTKSIIIKSGGILSRNEIDIPVDQLMSIATSGNLLWSLFGYSNIILYTYNGSIVPLIYIKKGKKFRKKLREVTGK
jgi:hypothetical protein